MSFQNILKYHMGVIVEIWGISVHFRGVFKVVVHKEEVIDVTSSLR